MKPGVRSIASTLSALLLPAMVSAALAQGTARSMDIDLSIRAAAMGGASNAVFWGDAGNAWSNPSLLGYQRGLRYEWGETQLVPTLADDVFIRSKVYKAGWGGVGFSFSGQPDGVGEVELEYGTSEITDAGGNVIAVFDAYETVKSWGFGINGIQFLENALGVFGVDLPPIARYADVSGGMNFKDLEMQLGPWTEYHGSTSAQDFGGLVRLTPLDGLEATDRPPVRLDAAYGYSELSYNDDAVVVFDTPTGPLAARVSRHRRSGLAARAAINLPAFRERLNGSAPQREWLRGLSPLLSIGYAADHAEIDGGSGTDAYETDGHGVEITLANVLTWRTGHYEDRVGDIDGSTSGWGIGLPLGPWGGLRYERATFPQARDSGLGDVEREAFSAWVDPVAIWRTSHAAP